MQHGQFRRRCRAWLWLVVATLCGLAARSPARAADRFLIEAETMRTDGKSWKSVDHFGWCDGAPSHGQWLRGSEGGAGTARSSLLIKTAGAYHVWVRYLDTAFRGPFIVSVTQNGRVKGEQTFDEVSVRATEEGRKKWGSGVGSLIWLPFSVTLEAGIAEVSLTKTGPTTGWPARHVDCLVLTDDLQYVPKAEDFFTPLYVKVTMGPAQQEPCVIHLYGRRPRGEPTWWIDHSNIDTAGLHRGQCYTGFDPKKPAPPTFLRAGSETPWFNLASLLDGVGNNAVHFYAMQEYSAALPAADFTVTFSRTPSEEGLLKRFVRTGSGGGIMVRIDLAKPGEILSDLELSEPEAGAAAGLAPMAGKRPARFPIMTGCAIPSAFYRRQTVANEIAVMKALGINSIGDADPAYDRQGFGAVTAGALYFYKLRNGCMSDPIVPDIRAIAQNSARAIAARQLQARTLYWNLMDEPGSVSLAHIAGCQKCRAGFRDYLKSQGLQPTAFGKAGWEEIHPVVDGNTSPELYYYTVNFRCQLLADVFALGTKAIQEVLPAARTMANFAEALTYNGNALEEGTDWFLLLGQQALTYGWTEDWLSYSTSYQLCGYRADFLRAACREKPFGMYNIPRSPWDTVAKTAAEIGHGSQAIYYFDYGPSWLSGSGMSRTFELYPALRRINFAVGKVEDYLVGARVPASTIAFLYPRTTDVWTLDRGHSNYGKERMGLYLLLRHLGYAVDVVTEDDAVHGRLGGYRQLFLTGSHLRRDAALALVGWVKGGGMLYLDAGSLARDEFNRPLNLDAGLGLARAPYDEKANFGREIYEGIRAESLETVTGDNYTLDSLCGLQKLAGAPPKGARILATFADASPAILAAPLDKGEVVFCGFFPGLGYLKSGVLAAQEAKKKQEDAKATPVTYNPPIYQEGYRALLARVTAGIRPPVTTNAYLVEANLLEHPKGRVITLSNWSGQPVKKLTVSVPAAAGDGKAFAAIGTITSQRRVGDRLSITLDLDAADFLVVPHAASGRTPASGTSRP